MHNWSPITVTSLDGDARHILLKYAHTYLQIHEFISLFHLLLFFPANQQAKQVIKVPLLHETYR